MRRVHTSAWFFEREEFRLRLVLVGVVRVVLVWGFAQKKKREKYARRERRVKRGKVGFAAVTPYDRDER